jgi:hypothetical protein
VYYKWEKGKGAGSVANKIIKKINILFERTDFLLFLTVLSILSLYGMGLRLEGENIKAVSQAMILFSVSALSYLALCNRRI